MKKYGILLLSLCVATPALADFWNNCTTYGGTIVQANSYENDKGGLCHSPSDSNLTNNCNGKRFCRGGNKMNWWSAFTWCESIGGHLASFSGICPGVQTNTNTSTGACPNIKGIASGGGWLNSGWGANNAFIVNLSSGAISSLGRNVATQGNGGFGSIYPICEE